jgi:hypothetical protein
MDHKEVKCSSNNLDPFRFSVNGVNCFDYNCDKLVDKLCDQLFVSAKQFFNWSLRWCGLFCSKFEPLTSKKQSITSFFNTSPSKPIPSSIMNTQGSLSYPKKSPEKSLQPKKTIVKSQTRRSAKQTSLSSFFPVSNNQK